MRDASVSILTSGIGLGVYMPALLLEGQLRGLGVEAEVEVLEGYYTDDGQRRQLAHARACRDDFALARMAHRMARDVAPALDGARLDALLARWAAERRRRFMVWSGFWLPILERHRATLGEPLLVDRCRIDAEVSASFRVHAELARDANEVWLWSWAERRTGFEIAVAAQAPLSFAARARRLVVHGGGWGIGTYRERLPDLRAAGWSCDVVVHDAREADGGDDRWFMIDPAWRPWHRHERGHVFPPLAELGAAPRSTDEHALFQPIRCAMAIVSKPGGGTLIDSLAAATPIVLLEPYGYAEASNAALWEHLGFGVSYARWRETGFDEAVLRRLHENLRGRSARGPDYARDYAARIAAELRA